VNAEAHHQAAEQCDDEGGQDDESQAPFPIAKPNAMASVPPTATPAIGRAQSLSQLAARIAERHEQHPKRGVEQVLLLAKRGQHHERHRQYRDNLDASGHV